MQVLICRMQGSCVVTPLCHSLDVLTFQVLRSLARCSTVYVCGVCVCTVGFANAICVLGWPLPASILGRRGPCLRIM
jgi:hypothetical protein